MDIDIKDFKDQKSLISNISSLTTSQPRSTSITKVRPRCAVRPSSSGPKSLMRPEHVRGCKLDVNLDVSLDVNLSQ